MRDIINIFEKSTGLTFKEVAWGSYSDQTDMSLYAFRDDEKVGRLSYSVYQGTDVSIQMIEVAPAHRRQGVGRALVLELQRRFPNTEINLGSLTQDGVGLFGAIGTENVPDEDAARDHSRLAQVRARLAQYKALAAEHDANPTPETTAAMQAAYQDWNDLHDEEDDLASAVQGRPATRRIFR